MLPSHAIKVILLSTSEIELLVCQFKCFTLAYFIEKTCFDTESQTHTGNTLQKHVVYSHIQ